MSPLSHHTHTVQVERQPALPQHIPQRYALVCPRRIISTDRDRSCAHLCLRRRNREHSIDSLLASLPAPLERQKAASNAPGRTIGLYYAVESLSSEDALRCLSRKAVLR